MSGENVQILQLFPEFPRYSFLSRVQRCPRYTCSSSIVWPTCRLCVTHTHTHARTCLPVTHAHICGVTRNIYLYSKSSLFFRDASDIDGCSLIFEKGEKLPAFIFSFFATLTDAYLYEAARWVDVIILWKQLDSTR